MGSVGTLAHIFMTYLIWRFFEKNVIIKFVIKQSRHNLVRHMVKFEVPLYTFQAQFLDNFDSLTLFMNRSICGSIRSMIFQYVEHKTLLSSYYGFKIWLLNHGGDSIQLKKYNFIFIFWWTVMFYLIFDNCNC